MAQPECMPYEVLIWRLVNGRRQDRGLLIVPSRSITASQPLELDWCQVRPLVRRNSSCSEARHTNALGFRCGVLRGRKVPTFEVLFSVYTCSLRLNEPTALRHLLNAARTA